MGSWYASMQVVKHREALQKIYHHALLKTNRYVDDSGGQNTHKCVDELVGMDKERQIGKTIHLKKMLKGHCMKLLRLVLSDERRDYVITNDMSQNDSDVVKQDCGNC